MFKLIFSIILTVIVMQDVTQNPLVGKYAVQNLLDNKEQEWFKKEYKKYKPLKPIIDQLTAVNASKVKIVVFAGSWCSDTQNLLPKFFKTLDETKNGYQVELYFMDRSKKLPDNSQTTYDINKIPTFILIEDTEEIGRIEEAVNVSIEKDLLKILLKN